MAQGLNNRECIGGHDEIVQGYVFFSSFPFPFENSLCFLGILALHYYCEEMIQPFLVNHILQEPSGEYNLVPKNFIKIFKNL